MSKPGFINHQDLCVEIIRSHRRKTMALQISKGKALIRLPQKLPVHFAESFVSQKYHWIKQKLAEHPASPVRKFVDGEYIHFLGEALTLNFTVSDKNQIVQKQDLLILKIKEPDTIEKRKKCMVSWLRKQAEDYCEQRLNVLSDMTGLRPTSFKVKSYKARWGSCSIRGEINLNWKLIMAPPEIIDYVIIHELCHLKHHNHSKAFWQLVKNYDPELYKHRTWLKNNSAQLEL